MQRSPQDKKGKPDCACMLVRNQAKGTNFYSWLEKTGLRSQMAELVPISRGLRQWAEYLPM